jgi:hypothetical protein
MSASSLRDRIQEVPEDKPRVRVRAVSRPGRAIAFLVVNVAVAAAAFAAGQLVQSPEGKLAETSREVVAVYAAVEERQVSEGVVGKASVKAGPETTISGMSVGGAALPVVTATHVSPGDVVENGAMVATVSDRPLFFLSLDIPLFRDLHFRDKGTDVLSLQKALGASETGTFDLQTSWAWRNLYAGVDMVPPGGVGEGAYVSIAEVQALPRSDFPPTVTSIASPGSLLSEEYPLLKLLTGPPQVEFRASAREATNITEGLEVRISSAAGESTSAKVAQIGPFEAATSGDQPQKAGHLIRVSLTAADTARFKEGSGVSVSTQAATPPTKSLPSVAIRQDGGSKYVLAIDDKGDVRRVNVLVHATASGWSSVEAAELTTGDRVQVTP